MLALFATGLRISPRIMAPGSLAISRAGSAMRWSSFLAMPEID
jgi:hypothetical protein